MNDKHSALLTDFIEDEELRGRRERGIEVTKKAMPRFFEYLENMNLEVNEVGLKEAVDYQGYLIESGRKDGSGKYKQSSIHVFIVAVKCFYEYLKRKGIVITNPFTEIKRLPEEHKLPRNILKEKQMNDFLDKLSHFEKVPTLKKRIFRYKLHVVSELMYSTGLRISETAGLKKDNIDFTRGIIKVYDGKFGKDKIVYLNEYAKEVLRIYLEKVKDVIDYEHHRKQDTIFGVHWKTLMDLMHDEFRPFCKKHKIPVQKTHNFRHALGTHLLRAGCDIRYVQEILGHSRLRSTEIYTKIDKEDLKKVLDKYHPRQFKKEVV